MFPIWLSTVRAERPSRLAICLVESPSANRLEGFVAVPGLAHNREPLPLIAGHADHRPHHWMVVHDQDANVLVVFR